MSTNRVVIFARVVAGLALVEGCSIYHGAYGAPVDAVAEARLMEERRKKGLFGALSSGSPSDDSNSNVVDLSDEGTAVGWGLKVRRRTSLRSAGSRSDDRCINCSAAPFVLKTVENLYFRGHADGVAALAPHVEFEDPAAWVQYRRPPLLHHSSTFSL